VLVERCKGALTDAEELDSEIEKCELTSAQFKAFEAAIKQFDAVKLKPRQGTAEGKNATQTLRVLFARASTLLRSRLDRLMVPFQTSQPEFYAFCDLRLPMTDFQFPNFNLVFFGSFARDPRLSREAAKTAKSGLCGQPILQVARCWRPASRTASFMARWMGNSFA
jgi:hypothetical protein